MKKITFSRSPFETDINFQNCKNLFEASSSISERTYRPSRRHASISNNTISAIANMPGRSGRLVELRTA